MVARVPDEVLAALARGATVVVPQERAARTVRNAWNHTHRAAGDASWNSADTLSWSAWTAKLWRSLLLDGITDRVLLNPVQERRLWSSVLIGLQPEFPSASLPALVQRCMQSHRRLEDFANADRLHSSFDNPGFPDRGIFAPALRTVLRHCRRDRLLPSAALEHQLAAILRQGKWRPGNGELVLFAFDEAVPARQDLLAAWRHAGGVIRKLDPARFAAVATFCQAIDPASEVEAFASWAHARLAADPNLRLALIVDNLREQRDEIEALLRDHLAPELAGLAPAGSGPFEFSLGRPLSTEPLLHTALDLLRWPQHPLPLARVSRLLLSSHLGRFASREQQAIALEQRAQLDRRLRRKLRLRPQLSLDDVLSAIRDLPAASSHALSGFTASLAALRTSELTPTSHHAPPPIRASVAVAAIREALTAAGWAAHLSSYNFQLRRRWDALLDSLSTLDLLDAEYTVPEFLDLLEQEAHQTVFAPESHEAPVQVLSLAEAAGQTFDAMWLLRCSDNDWPPEPALDSLLPASLQQELGMPGTSRHREQDRTDALVRNLLTRAPEIVFSFAHLTENSAEQHLATELAALRLAPTTLPAPAPSAPLATLERLTEESSIAPLPSADTPGGAELLRLQAACGFRAFAEHRLHATELAERSPGLHAGERGNAVHTALDVLWRDLETQQRLRTLTPQQRSDLLDHAAASGLEVAAAQAQTEWDVAYLDIQRTRLRSLLDAWLDTELNRPDFTVIARELRLDQVPVGPLRLSVRIDRIDAVDGSHVLLDYKTSPTTSAAWKGDRPELPQMLLYAMLAAAGHVLPATENPAAAPSAVAFANVVAGNDMSLSGLQREGYSLLPLSQRAYKTDLASLLPQWTRTVERLATDFAQGDVRVNPSNFPNTCEHCGHRILCRIDPDLLAELEAGLDQSAQASADDEEQDSDDQ